jgi:hypothetical protein
VGFTLSALRGEDVVDLLGVCGIHPDALAEPDLAVLAARLRATAIGDEELRRHRYDPVVVHAVRMKHERAAVRSCEEQAAAKQLVYYDLDQLRRYPGQALAGARIGA